MTDSLPRQGRIVAIDYGQVRMGLAISNADQSISSPYENYTRRGPAADAQYLQRLVAEEQVAGFVVGLPVHTSGKESQKSQEARLFGAWIAEQTGLPVCYFDERYSTTAANQALAIAGLTAKQRKKRRDMLAAQVILAAYLESSRSNDFAQPLDDRDP